MSVESMTYYELLRRQAATRRNAAAVQGLNAADLTYDGLMAQIDRVIETLGAWGIGRGDRVMVQLSNGSEALVLMTGIGALAVSVLIDPKAGAAEVDYLLRFVQPAAVIVEQGVDASARAQARQHGVRVIEIIPTREAGAGSFWFAEAPPPPTAAPVLNGPDDLSILLMTSGTTALPKLIPRTSRGMLVGAAIFTTFRDLALHETTPLAVLNYLPMHFAYGALLAFSGLISGGRTACMPGFDPNQVFHWIDVYRPMFLSGPAPIHQQLLAIASQYPDIVARHSLRFLNVGGSALPVATREQMDQVFAVPVVKAYAMTEVDVIAQRVLRPGSPDSGTSIGPAERIENTRIMASDGSFLPIGEVGEIVVHYPPFTGYWNNPEANEDAFIDGWFRTGDEGSMDAEGNVTILGRIKEVINSGGAKVSPSEVEAVLKQHPQVADAAVFGMRHPEIGEAVAAAVVGTVSERDLRKFASERLPFYKVPMRIVVVPEIPVSPSGKVQRNRLAGLLGLK